jgi:hypothetical protein
LRGTGWSGAGQDVQALLRGSGGDRSERNGGSRIATSIRTTLFRLGWPTLLRVPRGRRGAKGAEELLATRRQALL